MQEAKSENTESAAAVERRANARKNLLRKKREDSARITREDSEPARKAAIKKARSEEAKPAAAERRAELLKTIVEKKRERPAKYAAQTRQKREEPARRAARRQNASPSITEMAVQALRMVTSSGMLGLEGGGF